MTAYNTPERIQRRLLSDPVPAIYAAMADSPHGEARANGKLMRQLAIVTDEALAEMLTTARDRGDDGGMRAAGFTALADVLGLP
jgi:hypothetical protein